MTRKCELDPFLLEYGGPKCASRCWWPVQGYAGPACRFGLVVGKIGSAQDSHGFQLAVSGCSTATEALTVTHNRFPPLGGSLLFRWSRRDNETVLMSRNSMAFVANRGLWTCNSGSRPSWCLNLSHRRDLHQHRTIWHLQMESCF